MSSLHFTGSPWWLLLLLPGAFILWRQYRGGQGGRGGLLFGLQAAALVLLVVSLTGPEWVRSRAEFHNPSVLILRDRSGSFLGGEYLGLGGEYAAAREAIATTYRGKRFDALTGDFHERAWLTDGRDGPGSGGGTPLTSLAAAADFLDSAGLRNLKAVFLLSDGRPVLDSGLAARSWPVPVYPIVFPVTKVSEVQPDRVSFPASEDGDQMELEVAWTPVGPPKGSPRFRLLRGPRTLLDAELPAGEGEGQRVVRLPWKPGAGGAEGLRAVIRPASDADNFDLRNDTVPVALGSGIRAGRRLEVIKPLRSLDEKGMADLLRLREDVAVGMTAPEEAARLSLGSRDQIWVEAGALAGRPDLLKLLRESPAKVVVYARPGSQPSEIGGTKARWMEASLAAEVRPARGAADVFPAGVVRLKAVSAGPLALPALEAPWREAVAVSEGGRKGLLMGWFPLGPGRQGLFLALPRIWELLFDPQADFATREHLAGLLAAASALAERQEGAVKAVVPERAYAGLPFDAEFTLPAPPDGASRRVGLRAAPVGGGEAKSWTLEGPGPDRFRLEGLSLPEGRWILELASGPGAPLWRDSLTSASKASLELSRIGFDHAFLDDLASQSGGRTLRATAAAGVTALLPELPGAQVKSERTQSRRLHNTKPLFFLSLALLAASWVLRKRWDLD